MREGGRAFFPIDLVPLSQNCGVLGALLAIKVKRWQEPESNTGDVVPSLWGNSMQEGLL